MEEQLISYETAVLAKEKNFNLRVCNSYKKDGLFLDLDEVFFRGCEGGMSLDDWRSEIEFGI